MVRSHLCAVETWQGEEAPWSRLTETAAEELSVLAGLPSGTSLGGEEAKRFDLVMLELALALMGRSAKMEACRGRLVEIATALSTKMDIPTVARHAELIEEILTADWWQGLTVPIVERTRLRLRDLVHLIDRKDRSILYTDFEDQIGAPSSVSLSPVADFAAFKRKARAFLADHEDHVAIRRLRSGRPLTDLDIAELERMLLEAGVGSAGDLEQAHRTEAAQVRGFGVFLRSLVGLDRGAAQEHFAGFIAGGATADQIEFIGMLIEHLTRNGVMDAGLLYASPFADGHPDGPDGVFAGPVVEALFGKVREINASACPGADQRQSQG